MRKSELLAIKAREYERGLADAYKKFTITERDIQGWAEEARERVTQDDDWGYLEDTMKEMLTEIGVTICPKSNVIDK